MGLALKQVPCESLRQELRRIGLSTGQHSREELWRLLAERWKTCTPAPESITTDTLARTAIYLLTEATLGHGPAANEST